MKKVILKYVILNIILLFNVSYYSKSTIIYKKITSKYNKIFNINNNFNEILNKIKKDYKEDYSKFIPLNFGYYYNINNNYKINIYNTNTNNDKSDILKIRNKLYKIINNGSLTYNNIEYNTNLDKAYLLVGICNMYEKKYDEAINNFKEIIYKIPTSKLIYDAEVYKIISQYKLGIIDNTELLYKYNSSKNIKNKQNIKKLLINEYINSLIQDNKYKESLVLLENKDIISLYNKDDKIRINYLKYQLYDKTNNKLKCIKILNGIYRNNKNSAAGIQSLINMSKFIDNKTQYIKYKNEVIKNIRNNNEFNDELNYAIANSAYINKFDEEYKKFSALVTNKELINKIIETDIIKSIHSDIKNKKFTTAYNKINSLTYIKEDLKLIKTNLHKLLKLDSILGSNTDSNNIKYKIDYYISIYELGNKDNACNLLDKLFNNTKLNDTLLNKSIFFLNKKCNKNYVLNNSLKNSKDNNYNILFKLYKNKKYYECINFIKFNNFNENYLDRVKIIKKLCEMNYKKN